MCPSIHKFTLCGTFQQIAVSTCRDMQGSCPSAPAFANKCICTLILFLLPLQLTVLHTEFAVGLSLIVLPAQTWRMRRCLWLCQLAKKVLSSSDCYLWQHGKQWQFGVATSLD